VISAIQDEAFSHELAWGISY